MERTVSEMSLYHEVIETLIPLIQAFDQLGISYYIGGSVSSSLHGLPRRTQDVDVIVDIPKVVYCDRPCFLRVHLVAHLENKQFLLPLQLEYLQFPGFHGDVETETVLVQGQTDPIPDITIDTDTDTYALEFHFFLKQFQSSEVSRYAVRNVIEKYMKALPHLNSILETIKE